MPVDHEQVRQFLYHEAQLMDEHRYDEWLALWAEGALYWVPSNRDEIDPKREVSLVYDDAVRLKLRIARLKSGRPKPAIASMWRVSSCSSVTTGPPMRCRTT